MSVPNAKTQIPLSNALSHCDATSDNVSNRWDFVKNFAKSLECTFKNHTKFILAIPGLETTI